MRKELALFLKPINHFTEHFILPPIQNKNTNILFACQKTRFP